MPTNSLQSLHTTLQVGQGPSGPSAYSTAVKLGFVGTESEWLASLAGKPQTGEVRYFAKVHTDPNWLKCDGANVLRADYPALSTLMPTHGWDVSEVASDPSGMPAPALMAGYVADNGTFFTFGGFDGVDGSAWSTTDGVTWTHHAAFLPVTGIFVSFARNETIMVAVVTYPASGFAYSEDGGLSWSAAITGITHTPDVTMSEPIWDGNRFRSVTCSLTTGNYQVHSVDGKNWTKTNISAPPSGGTWGIITASSSPGWSYTYSSSGLHSLASYEGSIEYANAYVNPLNAMSRSLVVEMLSLGATMQSDTGYMLGLTAAGGISKGNGWLMSPIMEAGEGAVSLFKFNGMDCAVTIDGAIVGSTDAISWNRFTLGLPTSIFVLTGIARQDTAILVLVSEAEFNIHVARIAVNPLKMLLPSMPATSGMKPYIYAG